jgi:hypothetical protein
VVTIMYICDFRWRIYKGAAEPSQLLFKRAIFNVSVPATTFMGSLRARLCQPFVLALWHTKMECESIFRYTSGRPLPKMLAKGGTQMNFLRDWQRKL